MHRSKGPDMQHWGKVVGILAAVYGVEWFFVQGAGRRAPPGSRSLFSIFESASLATMSKGAAAIGLIICVLMLFAGIWAVKSLRGLIANEITMDGGTGGGCLLAILIWPFSIIFAVAFFVRLLFIWP